MAHLVLVGLAAKGTLHSLAHDDFDGLNNATQIPFALPWLFLGFPFDLDPASVEGVCFLACCGVFNALLFYAWLVLRRAQSRAAGGTGRPTHVRVGAAPVGGRRNRRFSWTDLVGALVVLVPLAVVAITLTWREGNKAHPVATIAAHDGSVMAVAFSSDGRLLASVGQDGAVRLWALDEEAAHPRLLTSVVVDYLNSYYDLAFSRDHRILVASHYDGEVTIWNVVDSTTLTESATLPRNVSGAMGMGMDLRADGKILAKAVNDHTVQLWDLADPAKPVQLATFDARHGGSTTEITFSNSGRALAVASSAAVELWNVADPSRPTAAAVVTKPVDGAHDITFSSDDALLAVAEPSEHAVTLWDVSDPSRARLAATLPTDGRAMAVAFGPDSRTLAAAVDKAVRLWDISDPRNPAGQATFSSHDGWIINLAFRPTGAVLASTGDNGKIRLWDESPRPHRKAAAKPSVPCDHEGAVAGLPAEGSCGMSEYQTPRSVRSPLIDATYT
ncbi:WD40 repeat domain-containing protein [Parafrankia sp. EUN1f]|uniref:WD40 repeat domain-containing protein n=1 Tax=Parafrankia sp. EUN1f TaxID=102897 RepID=UPI00055FF7E8|nr:WD40 repeat domain-containing protein [Parafrankia sp. EUN1f]